MSMAFTPADVKIGVAGPFTGPNATWRPALEGACRRWPIINAAGGIKGERLCWCRG